ncbi:MAG: LamG domain-containing protein [Halanaerobium sp.]
MLLNKLFVLLLVCLIIGFSATAALAQKENLIKKIYAHYPLDGSTIDQGPNQLHGEAVDKKRCREDRFGNKEGALSFAGRDDSLTLPVNISPGIMPQLTAALWLKVEERAGISTILSNNDGGFGRSLIIDSRKNRALLSVIAGNNQKVYGGINIPFNKWVFAAVSWNAENGKVSLYLIDQNKNFSTISTNNVNPGQGKDFITLGKNPVSGDFFRGTIDQLMIWDQILSMDQIKSLAD